MALWMQSAAVNEVRHATGQASAAVLSGFSQNLVRQAAQTIADVHGLGDGATDSVVAARREGLAR